MVCAMHGFFKKAVFYICSNGHYVHVCARTASAGNSVETEPDVEHK